MDSQRNPSTVAAGIVTYFPEMGRLSECLAAVAEQVELVIVVDNTPGGSIPLEFTNDDGDRLVVISNDRNLGVAHALNQVFEVCAGRGIDWVLTLDQDSVIGRGAVAQLRSAAALEDVGIACCRVLDRRVPEAAPSNGVPEREELDRCITSGSLVDVQVCLELGGFDTWMFIDYVDFEFCARLTRVGYRIVRVNGATLDHQLGQSQERRLLWRSVVVYNHNPARKYYYVRNALYYIWLHPRAAFSGKVALHLLERIAVTLMFERDRLAKLVQISWGVRDALIAVVGRRMGRAWLRTDRLASRL